jgi:hypothetical protein
VGKTGLRLQTSGFKGEISRKRALKFDNGWYNICGGGGLIDYLLLNIDYLKRGKWARWKAVARRLWLVTREK